MTLEEIREWYEANKNAHDVRRPRAARFRR